MFKIYVVKSELRTEILKAFSCESAITDFEKTSTIDKEVVLSVMCEDEYNNNESFKRFMALYEIAAIERDEYKDELFGLAEYCGTNFHFNEDTRLWEQWNGFTKPIEINGVEQFRFSTEDVYTIYKKECELP